MRFCLSVLAAVIVFAHANPHAFAEEIRQIVVAENSKTTDETVIFIANIEEGDDWNEDVRAQAEIELVSSGLFKEVDIFTEPHPQGGLKITILAKDKHSWVIAPTVYNQPTNKGGGFGFGENNLFGENKKLLLYGQVATGDSFLVAAYIDPSLGGSPISFATDIFLQNQRVFEYEVPRKYISNPKRVRETKQRYLNSGVKLGVNLFRSFALEARLRGAYVFYGDPKLVGDTAPEEVTPGATSEAEIAKPGAEGWDVSTELTIKYDGRANWYGISSGDRYQLLYETALPGLGSDFDYSQAKLSWTRARRYFAKHNLVTDASVAYGKNLPFQAEFKAGGTSLRGYEGNQFRGDFRAAFNAEYSVHLFSMPFPLLEKLAVRGLAFYDSRYTTFLNPDIDGGVRNYLPGTEDQKLQAPFKNAVGLGTRFFARSIVLPLLGLDVGYGLESGAIEVYFAIGLTDV